MHEVQSHREHILHTAYIGVIIMFVWNMMHNGYPFCHNKISEALFCRASTPIQMFSNSLHPKKYGLIAFFFTSFEKLFGNAFTNMPNVMIMLHIWVVWTDPLCNAFMSITDEGRHFQTFVGNEFKASLGCIQFHCITWTRLICLRIMNWWSNDGVHVVH